MRLGTLLQWHHEWAGGSAIRAQAVSWGVSALAHFSSHETSSHL